MTNPKTYAIIKSQRGKATVGSETHESAVRPDNTSRKVRLKWWNVPKGKEGASKKSQKNSKKCLTNYQIYGIINTEDEGSPKEWERLFESVKWKTEGANPTSLKKITKKYLTNPKTHAIIRSQRARERQPESNGLTHESL